MDGQMPIGNEEWRIENFKLPLWETRYNVYGNPKDGVEFDAVTKTGSVSKPATDLQVWDPLNDEMCDTTTCCTTTMTNT